MIDDELRMDAYYYGFDPTGERVVDRVLSAVACAGKAFHHTEAWGDAATCCSYPTFAADQSPVQWIEGAAKEAATEIARLREEVARLQRERDEALGGYDGRIQDIASENFGPFPVQTPTEAMNEIERGVFAMRQERDALAVRVGELADSLDKALCNAGSQPDTVGLFNVWRAARNVAERARAGLQVEGDQGKENNRE